MKKLGWIGQTGRIRAFIPSEFAPYFYPYLVFRNLWMVSSIHIKPPSPKMEFEEFWLFAFSPRVTLFGQQYRLRFYHRGGIFCVISFAYPFARGASPARRRWTWCRSPVRLCPCIVYPYSSVSSFQPWWYSFDKVRLQGLGLSESEFVTLFVSREVCNWITELVFIL